MKHKMQELSDTELEAVCGGDGPFEDIMRMVERAFEMISNMTQEELEELYEMLQHEEYAL